MRYISILALMLSFRATGVQAQEQLQVRMTFSGSGTHLAPPITLVSTGNGEVFDMTTTGDGSLGPFTVHEVNANATAPSGSCAGLPFPFVSGGGVFRFQDGSLLTYKLKAGTLCVHPPSADFTIIEQITGGTGRFANASGTLTIKVPLAYPVLLDAAFPPNPILIVIPSADVTGTIILPHREE